MEILTAVIIVTIIGLIIGILLTAASIIFAVPVDEKAKKITEALPGANCGACGFSGCSGYAKALSEGSAEVGLCSVGGEEAALKISDILGVKANSLQKNVAIVMCNGTNDSTSKKMIYQGINSCKSAVQLYGGDLSCYFGCLGFGDCVNVCEYNAIKICDGIAKINQSNCVACKKCIKACPKGIISLIPVKKQAVALCSNCDKGAETRKACTNGCIGCKKCIKACPENAITVTNFNATIDPEKCCGCGSCVSECIQGCIKLINC